MSRCSLLVCLAATLLLGAIAGPAMAGGIEKAPLTCLQVPDTLWKEVFRECDVPPDTFCHDPGTSPGGGCWCSIICEDHPAPDNACWRGQAICLGTGEGFKKPSAGGGRLDLEVTFVLSGQPPLLFSSPSP